ncbi:hypothetical protein [Paenibacillus sp. UMB4589-SE434]|uniref:hypothetical protein n=1 Tax=Paenibacillus sp. UMB4589-SE434 TaxID=3046314 RepID=UPI00254BB279|nr:hypothetical protein [Paenibacillus sp. UMB4589-SE434]MDK8180103.1 hypothetical protein [Paenibacillus sp. UMB4589-SE434]
MKKWLAVSLLTIVVAIISACSMLQGTQEREAGVGKEIALTVQHEQQELEQKINKVNESVELGMSKVFSNLMSLKLPQGLELESNETSNSKFVYTDNHKKVKLELRHDPEQPVTDAGIDGARLKMKAILEHDSEGEKLEWLKNETMLVHRKHIAVIEVIMPSQKGDTYRLLGWAELDGALLEISFSAPVDEKDSWQKPVVEMIESIQM